MKSKSIRLRDLIKQLEKTTKPGRPTIKSMSKEAQATWEKQKAQTAKDKERHEQCRRALTELQLMLAVELARMARIENDSLFDDPVGLNDKIKNICQNTMSRLQEEALVEDVDVWYESGTGA